MLGLGLGLAGPLAACELVEVVSCLETESALAATGNEVLEDH